MRRPLHLIPLVVLVAFTMSSALPLAAFAGDQPLPDCDPSTNPDRNVWSGTPGAWSDPSRWSRGHVPTPTETACGNDDDSTFTPTIDIDVDVDALQFERLQVPSGRTMTANLFATGDLQVDVDATVRPRAAAFGDWTIGGRLELTDAVDLSSVRLLGHGTRSSTLTIAGSGPIHYETDGLYDVGNLYLTPGTMLHLEALEAAGSITGGPGAAIEVEYGDVRIGTTGESSTLAVPVTATSLETRGNVLVTADLDVDGAVSTYAGTVELRGIHIEGAPLWIGANDDAGEHLVRLTTGTVIDTESIGFHDDIDVRLESCSMSAELTSVQTYDATLRIGDVGCIDPPVGTERDFFTGVEADPWFSHDEPPAVRFSQSGTFDGGGTLRINGAVGIDAGVTLVDDRTSIRNGESMTVRTMGAGTATVVGLFDGDPDSTERFGVAAGAGQVLRLVNPTRSTDDWSPCMRGAIASDGGRIEIVDDMPQERGCTWIDSASHGSAPIRYRAAGLDYEPLRSYVVLDGAAWTTAGTARSYQLSGAGVIHGAVSITDLSVYSGILQVDGSITAEALKVNVAPDATNGMLNLRLATVQHLPTTWTVNGPPTVVAHRDYAWVIAPGVLAAPTTIDSNITRDPGTVWVLDPGTGILRLGDALQPPTSPVPPAPDPAPPTDTTGDDTTPTRTLDWISWTGTRYGDRMSGKPGNDRLRGLGGFDVLRGLAGNDVLDGGAGNDRLFGGAGRDVLVGGAGHDRLDGGAGNDRLLGGAGRDVLIGGAGTDSISCGPGPRDRVIAGPGNDVVNCRNRRGGDVIDCGSGRDRVVADRGDVIRRCERITRR
jgi:Ca2+-binding RTX toxin-like protein